MKNRATVRAYQNRPIEDVLLKELLETACRASNTGNMQVYSIIVTRDAERKKALAACHFNQPQVTSAPVVLTFCADLNRFSKWCMQRQTVPGYDNLQAMTYASIDAVIAAQTFCVAAEEKGLGICYLGTTTYLADKIAHTLQLPSLVFPITTVTAGYPIETPVQSDRLPLEAVLHEECYHNYSEADINRLYQAKETLPENIEYVRINQKKTLAQVFAEIRYTKRDNENFSNALIDTLEKQGFLKK